MATALFQLSKAGSLYSLLPSTALFCCQRDLLKWPLSKGSAAALAAAQNEYLFPQERYTTRLAPRVQNRSHCDFEHFRFLKRAKMWTSLQDT